MHVVASCLLCDVVSVSVAGAFKIAQISESTILQFLFRSSVSISHNIYFFFASNGSVSLQG